MNASSPTTIAAIATPPGRGAVAIIRVSGPESITVASRLTGRDISTQESHRLRHARALDANGEPIDDGLLAVFRAPRSYTGEDSFEFSCHGGVLVTREILARILECGAVHAEPGEFTKRAFLHGKLDLTQAEGVMDLISAQTRLAMRAARSQLDGHLGRRTMEARDTVLEVLAHLEAWIDFPDEDIDPATGSALSAKTRSVLATVDQLLATAERGSILREGVRTVIYGPPNVGKSSLLNRLLGFDRAIVSDTPGTTRDTIEETISLHGIPLRLVDTAGIRRSDDLLESAGIARTMNQIGQAGLLLSVANVSEPPPADFDMSHEVFHTPSLLVLNKSDLPEHAAWSEYPQAIRVSCATGNGFECLGRAIRNALQLGENDWGEHDVAINARHQASLQAARVPLLAAIDLLENPALDPAIAAIELRGALDHLGEIPGKVDTEDLLTLIFSSFCIGK